MPHSTQTITLADLTLTKMAQIAQRLARQLKPGMTVCLWGDLGAGKTTFCRLILQALNPEIIDVPSPTFTLIQQYDTPVGDVWHCDLYRLKNPHDIIELGLEDAFFEAIVLVEWPEKMGSFLPTNRIDCRLMIQENGEREMVLTINGGEVIVL